MLQVLLLHIIYGATFTISKILIQYSQPVFVIGIRMVLAGLLLLIAAKMMKKNTFKYDRYSILCLAQLAIFGIFLPYSLRYWSLSYLTVVKTAFVYNLGPFISFAFAYFMLKERLNTNKLVGMLIGFSSIIPMFIFTDLGEASVTMFAGISWPELAMLASVTSFCYGWIVMKKLQQHQEVHPFALNGRTMLIGGLLSLVASYASGEAGSITNPMQFFLWMGLIIIMTNVICFSLYAYLLKRFSATLVSLGSLVAPVSAAATGWLYFGEPVTLSVQIAAVLIVIGFSIFYYDEFRKNIGPRSKFSIGP